MAYEQFELRPLSPGIGAEILGIDLAKIDDPTQKEVHQALLEYKVVFFRDQDLTTDEHLAFARRFGELEVHPFGRNKDQHPEVLMLTHDENSRGTENLWHSDVTWRVEPSLGSVLRAHEVPEVGGDKISNLQIFLGLGGLASRGSDPRNLIGCTQLPE